MTNPISSDNFSAHLAPREQRTGTQAADRRTRSTPEALAGHAGERADVDRAHRRLSQETERSQEPAIRSADEGRRRISDLKALLAADPRAALDAHARVDTRLFEAAMARPTT